MNQQEFDQIYPKKITPTQHEVLDFWLKGLNDNEIAKEIVYKAIAENNTKKNGEKLSPPDVIEDKLLKSTEATVRSRFSEIFTRFNLPDRNRVELMQLFIDYRPNLITDEHKQKLAETGKYEGVKTFPSSDPPIKPDCKNNPLPNDNSDFYYIERPPLEQTCYDAILKPGGLIRIRSPKKMGKTLLLEKVVAYARSQGYRTVKLQFGDPQILKLSDADFCKWFCSFVSEQLNLENKLDEYWTSPIFTTGCTEYFQNYLLSSIESNLFLALDQFEALFQKQEIFETLCYLLREWHDYAQPDDNKGKIWQKLRIVMANSTEKYPQLPKNHSPFNVGIGVDESTGLRGFTEAEAKTLLNHYHLQIKLADSDFNNLVNLVGGHPYLLQQAFAYLKRPDSQSIGELREKAITEESIFIGYLREILEILENNTNLQEAYRKAIVTDRVKLDSESLFKLHSLGLIKLSGNYCVSSCELYRQYFSHRLVDA